jgi:aryl-alcohol dehydrogenase-like predicted oxidoreductase
MRMRPFGGDSVSVGEIGLGCWQIGGDQWGDVSDADALATLGAAVDAGTTFLDTADVYGSGRSEELVGRFHTGWPSPLFIATKLGRFGKPGWPENFTPATVRAHTEASLKRLRTDALDLTQLHCMPLEVLERGEMFEALRALKEEGKIKRFGASVESVAEARACLAQDGLASLQVIFNIFRQTPALELFDEARAKGVAIIVRLPLASGLLAGKMTAASTFAPSDHRSMNRNGEKFNVGETFAGLTFEKGLELVEKLRPMVPSGYTMAEFALRWILDHPAVSVIIPGARNAEQARANAKPSELAPLPQELHAALRDFYLKDVKGNVRGPD